MPISSKRYIFPSDCSTRRLYKFSFSPTRATCHDNLRRSYHPNSVGEHKRLRISLCSFLQPNLNSSFLAPNAFLSTLFSNTLSKQQ
jgi:hypothetical protein